jgi:hypothetical protein
MTLLSDSCRIKNRSQAASYGFRNCDAVVMVCWGFCVGVQPFGNLYVNKIMVDYLSGESELELVSLPSFHLDQLPGCAAMMMH